MGLYRGKTRRAKGLIAAGIASTVGGATLASLAFAAGPASAVPTASAPLPYTCNFGDKATLRIQVTGDTPATVRENVRIPIKSLKMSITPDSTFVKFFQDQKYSKVAGNVSNLEATAVRQGSSEPLRFANIIGSGLIILPTDIESGMTLQANLPSFATPPTFLLSPAGTYVVQAGNIELTLSGRRSDGTTVPITMTCTPSGNPQPILAPIRVTAPPSPKPTPTPTPTPRPTPTATPTHTPRPTPPKPTPTPKPTVTPTPRPTPPRPTQPPTTPPPVPTPTAKPTPTATPTPRPTPSPTPTPTATPTQKPTTTPTAKPTETPPPPVVVPPKPTPTVTSPSTRPTVAPTTPAPTSSAPTTAAPTKSAAAAPSKPRPSVSPSPAANLPNTGSNATVPLAITGIGLVAGGIVLTAMGYVRRRNEA